MSFGRRLLDKLPLLGVITITIVLPLVIWRIPIWQVNSVFSTNTTSKQPSVGSSPKELAELENSYRGTLVQAVGGLFFLVTASLAYKNFKIAEDKQVTERFSKSVEMLGSEKVEVRLGGVYMLERISRDSPEDYGTVIEVLSAFVRERSPRVMSSSNSSPENDLDEFTETDIQAVVKVIGRRRVNRIRLVDKIDLTHVRLSGSNLGGLDFSGVNFSGSLLRGTYFHKATLNGVFLTDAILSSAKLSEAQLNGANIMCANLVMANLPSAQLNNANLNGANMSGAFLRKAILRNANLSCAKLTSADLVNAES